MQSAKKLINIVVKDPEKEGKLISEKDFSSFTGVLSFRLEIDSNYRLVWNEQNDEDGIVS